MRLEFGAQKFTKSWGEKCGTVKCGTRNAKVKNAKDWKMWENGAVETDGLAG